MKRMWIIFALASGCAAHSGMRGSVVMKVNDTQAHVCMGVGEVKEGQEVALFQSVCKKDPLVWGNKMAAVVGSCEKKRVGAGTVEKVLNEHYSVVRFASGVSFQEGDIVETHEP